MYDRPKIDTENLVNGRLKPEEFDKVLKYTLKLTKDFYQNIEKKLDKKLKKINSDSLDSIDELTLMDENDGNAFFNVQKEVISFIDNLPLKDKGKLYLETIKGTRDTLEGDI